MFQWARIAAQINIRADKNSYPTRYLSACRRVKRVEIATLVGGQPFYLCAEIRIRIRNVFIRSLQKVYTK